MGNRTDVDVPLLFRLWADHTIYRADLPKRLGVSESTLRRLAQQYGLPRRSPSHKTGEVNLGPLPTDPTPDQIAERARECRERHFLQRRNEPEETARSKAASWRRGDTVPRGAHHDKV